MRYSKEFIFNLKNCNILLYVAAIALLNSPSEDCSDINKTLLTLFTKFLTSGLTGKLCYPLDDWLDWLIPTNHQTDYIILRLTRKLKVL